MFDIVFQCLILPSKCLILPSNALYCLPMFDIAFQCFILSSNALYCLPMFDIAFQMFDIVFKYLILPSKCLILSSNVCYCFLMLDIVFQYLGCVTFSGKIKRFSADHSPWWNWGALWLGALKARPVIGRRELCYRPLSSMLSSMLSSVIVHVIVHETEHCHYSS